MDERAAVLRLKDGDIGGLEELVVRHHVKAVRAAYLIVRDRPLAEDIVQSAFVRAYERIHQFDATRPFGPWFLKSVVNDAIKAAARRQNTLSLDGIADKFTSLDQAMKLGSRDVDLEERLEAIETNEALSAAIAQLPPEQRATLVLRYYLGFSDDEISSQLDSTPATIRWRLHSARQRLRKLLPPWIRPVVAGENLPIPHSAIEVSLHETSETDHFAVEPGLDKGNTG